ncbi:MAG: hypothetical protein WEB57_10340 [Pseudohongiellaceae bacterium]
MKRLFIITLVVFLQPAWAAESEYNRDDWEHWEDFDQDCQNTRHELLISRSLAGTVHR